MRRLYSIGCDRWKGAPVAAGRFEIFAFSALMLASLDICGSVSFSVARRTAEIGVRLALGARPPELMAMVFREGMLSAVSGLALAWDWTCDTINTSA